MKTQPTVGTSGLLADVVGRRIFIAAVINLDDEVMVKTKCQLENEVHST